MKLNTCVKQTKEATKNLKRGTNRLKIEVKEKNRAILDVKRIISLFHLFNLYIQISIFIATPKTQLHLQLTFKKYVKHLIIL